MQIRRTQSAPLALSPNAAVPRDAEPAPRWRSRRLAWGVLLLGVVACETIISEPLPWFPDFRIAYYPAGAAVLHGESLSGLISRGVTGFVNLPVVAYLFAPLALLPWKVAAAGPFLLAGLLAVALAFVMLARLVQPGRTGRWLLLLLFAVNGPLIYSLKLGNTSHFVLLMLIGALWLLRRGRTALAGALLAFAALIKLPLLLFGCYFVLRRDRAGTAGFTLVLLLAAAASLLLFGLGLHREWLDVAVFQFGQRTLGAFNVQSIPAVLARLRVPPPPLFDWTPFDPTGMERIATRLVQLAMLTVAAWAWWNTGRQPGRGQGAPAGELQFLLVLCLAVILSPLSWTHYYCWFLIPAGFMLAGRLAIDASRLWFVLGCAAMALTTPLVVFPHFTAPLLDAIYIRAGASNAFLGGVLWFVVVAAACRPPRRRHAAQAG